MHEMAKKTKPIPYNYPTMYVQSVYGFKRSTTLARSVKYGASHQGISNVQWDRPYKRVVFR